MLRYIPGFIVNEKQYGFRGAGPLRDLPLSCSLITESINLRGLIGDRGGGGNVEQRHVTDAHLKPLLI